MSLLVDAQQVSESTKLLHSEQHEAHLEKSTLVAIETEKKGILGM